MTATIPEPTAGSIANSYELVLDIDLGTPEAPQWTNIPDITAFNPTPAIKTIDRSTYAHKGNDAASKVGETFNSSFNVMGIRDDKGEFQPELVALLALAAPETRGSEAEGRFRYYDELGASYAYEFTATVQDGRANTGNADPGMFTFTLTSTGSRTSIANPNAPVAG